MLTTPHVLLGLYFITYYPPQIALPAALISHLLFDFFLPHWNPHIFTEMKKHGRISQRSLSIIIVDVVLALSFTLFLSYQSLPDIIKIIFIWLAAFLAILPDFLEMPYYLLGIKHPLLLRLVTFEHKFQAKADNVWGVLSQLLLIVLCIWQIFSVK